MRRLVAAGLAATAVIATAGTAGAAGNQSSTGATIGVEVQLGGFQTPPEVWRDPCPDHDPYTEHYSIRDDRQYKSGDVKYLNTQVAPPGSTQWVVFENGEVTQTDGDTWSTAVKTHVHWLVGCRDPLTKEPLFPNPITSNPVWVPLVTQETVVPALYAYLDRYLAPPALSWPGEDRQFGWLYVNTAQDFRIDAPPTITLTATVTNVTGSVTGTVTATPSGVTFEPGEPGGGVVPCSVGAATAGYSTLTPGCHYRYQHSSVISPTNAFGTRTVLWWDVTTSSPTLPDHSLPTISYDAVEVAEVQAVVTG